MNKQQLAAKIWESANKMRSKIEANEYKDYILGFIFYKFLSEKEVKYLKANDWTDEYLPELTEEDTETVESIQKNLGYFISYDNLFSTWLAKGSDFSVQDVRDALSAFSRLINPTHKKVFEGVFDTLQTGLSKLGDSASSQSKSISDLIQLIKDIPMDGKQGYDVLGFIYEYLIEKFAANAGKKAGEFYTPHEVSLLMSEIVANHLKDREKIEIFDKRYSELSERLYQPSVAGNPEEYQKIMKEIKSIEEIVLTYRKYKEAVQTEKDSLEILEETSDKELKELAQIELDEAKNNIKNLAEELKILLLPKDPNDERNVIVEIRGGAGGEESALFSAVLFRMYSMYAEKKGFKIEIINANETEIGGYKEISFMIEGEGAYSRFKYESGVHRVQRVPETESQGRVHTSTTTVAVLPEAEDVELEIGPNDLKIDTFRSSGAGGQHINKTSSAIRITHLPTGMVVECQDERSQYKNKDKALKVLKSRLLKEKQDKQASEIAENRKMQVGTGDRSERIRTYNYPQGRVTDHRIGLTLYKLEEILNGSLDEVIDALVAADRAEKLKESMEK